MRVIWVAPMNLEGLLSWPPRRRPPQGRSSAAGSAPPLTPPSLSTAPHLTSTNPAPLSSVVEQYMGKKFEPSRPLPEWRFEDYLGWHEQVRGVCVCVGGGGG